MHWRGHSASMQRKAVYGDVVADVRAELLAQVELALAAGVDERSPDHRSGTGIRQGVRAQLAIAATASRADRTGSARSWSVRRGSVSSAGCCERPGRGTPAAGRAGGRHRCRLGAGGERRRLGDPRARTPTDPGRPGRTVRATWRRRLRRRLCSKRMIGSTCASAVWCGKVRQMADRITLTGLRIFGHHGVFEHEKRDGQDFVVDITLWLDLTDAVTTDDLAATVHYGELAQLAARHHRRSAPGSDRGGCRRNRRCRHARPIRCTPWR